MTKYKVLTVVSIEAEKYEMNDHGVVTFYDKTGEAFANMSNVEHVEEEE